MNVDEKFEMLKDTIYQLYSKEGRSRVYISKLLKLDRKKLGLKIKEWNLPDPEPAHHLKPSNKKFLNRNRLLIISRLKSDIPMKKIAEELGISKSSLFHTFVENDPELYDEYKKFLNRKKEKVNKRKQFMMDMSSFEYNIEDYDGEEWKQIKGYDRYYISNYGRVKSYAERYDAFHLIVQQPNKNNNRFYVRITNNEGKSKNLNVARLVGFAFVDGYSEEKNTINHKDGNVQNNKSSNLEWISQSENNIHSYRVLNRSKVNYKKYKFKKIIYKDKYEFKSITSLANFLGKSPTQVRRYLDNADKYDIKLII